MQFQKQKGLQKKHLMAETTGVRQYFINYWWTAVHLAGRWLVRSLISLNPTIKNTAKKKFTSLQQDEAIVTRQITETWSKIQSHDFYTGCGKEDCHWCNFVKTNKLDINAVMAGGGRTSGFIKS